MSKLALITSATLIAATLAGCNNANDDAAPVDTTQPSEVTQIETTATSEPTANQAATGTAENTAQTQFIDINEAIKVALSNTSGTVTSVEFDTHDNGARADYEVDIISGDIKHEIKIDAATSEVISATQKSLDAEDRSEYEAQQQASTTIEQAIQIAADSLNGTVTEIEFDIENDQPVYETNVLADNRKYDVDVDANTGSIIKSELD